MYSFYRRFAAGSVGGLLALAGLAPCSWAQASAPQTERLAYSLMVGGLHVGDAVVELDQDTDRYSTGLKLSSRGVAKWLRDFRADLSSAGGFKTDGNIAHPVPATYRRDWSGAEIDSSMTMTWDAATRMTQIEERYINRETGEPVAREDLPWNKNDTKREREEEKKRAVPPDMRVDTLDPMAAFIAARHQVMAQGASKGPVKFRVPVFDGQRRYDIVGTTTAPRTTTINDATYNVITVNTTLVPVAGFSEKGIERMRQSRGKLLLTADERFIPVQVTIENEFLSGVMNLKADCKVTPAACSPSQQVQAAAASE
ncbi:MAG: DUF3108 domain-containing protein [Rhodospirillaceae bacterium]